MLELQISPQIPYLLEKKFLFWHLKDWLFVLIHLTKILVLRMFMALGQVQWGI